MPQFITFLRKEFSHLLRDRKTLLILFGLPIVQILIFGFALTNEVKNSRIIVVDNARDNSSRKLIDKIESSSYFEVESTTLSPHEIEGTFKEGLIRMAIIIPVNFEHDLAHINHSTLQVVADASDPNTATTLTNYLNAIIQDYQREIDSSRQPMIRTTTRMLYNPQLKGVHNFVPGVMALVLMLVCVMMTAVSIVREKETGTMEILLVSPFKPIMVIISKAIPYLLLSILNVISILILSVFVLELPINGSLMLLMCESILFIVTCLAIGIFISVKTSSQQVAMLISLMGMMLPTIMFSGFMFPIENMPVPLQVLSNVVPAKWFYSIVKSVMIEGVGLQGVWKETLVLVGIAAIMLFLSLRYFKIRLS